MPNYSMHTARINDPDKYKSIRHEKNAFDEGIDVLWGILDNDKTEVQSIRFDTMKWSVAEAKKWLEVHFYEAIEFEEGIKPEATFRVCKPGNYKASTGPLKITATDIAGAVEAFKEAQYKGVIPSLKYTHASGLKAVGVGKITDMWVGEDGWLMAKAIILNSDIRDGLANGVLTDISLEGYGTFPYSDREYGLVISAVSILAPGEFPAVPGAGLTEIAAGADDDKVVIMLNETDVETKLEVPVEEPVEEEPAEGVEAPSVEDRLVELETSLAACMSRIESLEEAMKPQEEPAPEEPETEDMSASIDEVEKKLQAGSRKAFREYINSVEGSASKKLVLAAASVFAITPEPEVLLSGELGDPEPVEKNEELPLVDRQEKAILDVMASDKVGFVEATKRAASINPELFNS